MPGLDGMLDMPEEESAKFAAETCKFCRMSNCANDERYVVASRDGGGSIWKEIGGNVDRRRIELPTFALRTRRSPS
jgi:hypothetical protein